MSHFHPFPHLASYKIKQCVGQTFNEPRKTLAPPRVLPQWPSEERTTRMLPRNLSPGRLLFYSPMLFLALRNASGWQAVEMSHGVGQSHQLPSQYDASKLKGKTRGMDTVRINKYCRSKS
ncbi:hypothetical protein CDAR_434581 [Caerostris darwini]|uniref:Uncharacterized protein n=1 Tax=Caerostris darwini TaxID=1538125 RepID=A0AAV4PI71_9ARAC|nr:hypothetical protein CDAR_434581 [Caerostris darwini]